MGTDTVDAVMARVFSLAGEVVTPAVYLAHNGTKLEGARTIADYKIAMGATLVAQTVAGLTINFFVASGSGASARAEAAKLVNGSLPADATVKAQTISAKGSMAASAGLEEGVPSETVAPSLSLLERLRMVVPAAQTEENHWLMGAAIFPKDGSAPAYAPEVQDEINAAMEKVACTLQEMEDAAALPGGEASAEGTHVEPPKHAYRVDDSSKTFPEGRVRLYCKATAKPLARGTGGGSSGTAGTGGDLEEPAVAVVPATTTGGGAPPTTAKASPPPPPTFNLAGVGPAALEKKTSPYYCDLANWVCGRDASNATSAFGPGGGGSLNGSAVAAAGEQAEAEAKAAAKVTPPPPSPPPPLPPFQAEPFALGPGHDGNASINTHPLQPLPGARASRSSEAAPLSQQAAVAPAPSQQQQAAANPLGLEPLQPQPLKAPAAAAKDAREAVDVAPSLVRCDLASWMCPANRTATRGALGPGGVSYSPNDAQSGVVIAPFASGGFIPENRWGGWVIFALLLAVFVCCFCLCCSRARDHRQGDELLLDGPPRGAVGFRHKLPKANAASQT